MNETAGVPEGDTIARTGTSLRRWIGGRVVTAANDSVRIGSARLVGRTVSEVTTHGKNLSIAFSSAPSLRAPDLGDNPAPTSQTLVLYTHMMMSGSWHVYSITDRWQRPRHQAKVIVQCGERLAVCFNAPIIELTTSESMPSRERLARLGPDILRVPLDIDEVVARAVAEPSDRPIGELLLDQRIVAGIGNIYRCEAMFLVGVDPRTTIELLESSTLVDLIERAAALMHRSVSGRDRDFGVGAGETWVYRRAGRPCRRCGTVINARPQGTQARRAYWCPSCQPRQGAAPH